MYYLVNGNMGNEVTLSKFGFVVNDEIVNGEWGHYYGDVPTLQDAMDEIDNLVGRDWKNIPYCYNNYPNPSYPIIFEHIIPIVEQYSNATPFYHVHSTDGTETIQGLINGKYFSDIRNTWDDDGGGEIGIGTPIYSGIFIDYANANDVRVRWLFTALPTGAIKDGKFDFDENEYYGSYSVGIEYHPNNPINRYTWHVGQYTGYHIAFPSSWYELDGTDVTTPTDDDPFEPGGDSGTGGGNGDFDSTGDDIEIPSLPTLSASDTGFITLFNPSILQLKSLASYMWSGAFDLNSFRKIFADPMNCILGLSIVPVTIPNGSSKEVKVGNISTGISMTTAGSQYVEVDCGSIAVNEYWGAYLDYDPYTKAEIYLPYVGSHPIAVDDIMRKTVTVKYHVDILSGACTAYVKCGSSVLYEFIGQCSSSIPVTGNDWTNVINGVLNIAGSIGTMVATGGLSAPISAGSAIAGGATIASTAINSMKPSIEKSGSMSGTGGMLSVQTPYLILTRPRQALPTGQNSFMGYPSFITENLGSLTGYTEIESIHLDNVPATNAELNEIETLLRKGVIL